MSQRTRVGIINVTGYAGVELARILCQHPHVELVSVTGRSAANKRVREIWPHLDLLDLVITENLTSDVEFVFSALGHKDSAPRLLEHVKQKTPICDLSADFRLHDASAYREWYEVEHPKPSLLDATIYGLPELHKGQLMGAKLVGNPGCYPTGAILALAPAVQYGLIEGNIVIDGKSGVSGAGRSLNLTTHFSEVNESVRAYAVDGHRHYPEITQELAQLAPDQHLDITFMPHLIPMTRGILSSCYAPLANNGSNPNKDEIIELYRNFYRDSPFVRVSNEPPHTKQTLGSNNCFVYPTVDIRTNRLIVISAIDNLVKGAAGQAVQNMNLMLGIEETSGLKQPGLYP